MSSTPTPTRSPVADNLFPYLCLGFAVLAGIFFRFFGLGVSPLSVDEYYLTRSIVNVMESGLPEFSAGGGYYTRGLIQQYFTAGILMFGGDMEWSARLFPVICSLICMPAIYLIGKRMGGIWVACASVAVFCLSLWEIEFARFARMYTPFQAVFLWYTYFIIRAIIDGESRSLLIAYLLSFVGIFVYEGSPFLLVLNFLPLFSVHCRTLSKYLLLTPVLIFIGAGLEGIDRLDDGPSKLPEDLKDHERANVQFGILFPPILLKYALNSTMWTGLLLIPAISTLFLTVKLMIEQSRLQLWSLLFSLALLSAFFNQIGLAFISLIIGAVLFRSPDNQTRLSPQLAIAVSIVITINTIYWTAFGFSTQEWFGNISNLPLETYPNKTLQLIGILTNYPESITRFILPWLRPMPIMTIMLFAGLGYAIFVAIFKPNQIRDDLRLLIAIVAAAILFISFIDTLQKISRYSFFFYPLFILIFCYSTHHFCQTLFDKKKGRIAFAAVLAVFLTLSDDIGFSHLRNITQPEIMYRTQYSLDKAAHYYPRRDFQSPAEYVNRHRKTEDVVISELSVVDLYLQKKMDYIYLPMEQNRFWQRAVLQGTKDRWTNADLLFRKDDVLTRLNHPESRIWLMVFAIDWMGEPITEFRERYRQQLAYTSSDGTIDVFLIEN